MTDETAKTPFLPLELPLTPWQRAWRDGIAPQLSTAGLAALATALESDDIRLLQGATCSPPPMDCVRDWPVEGACAVTFCGWKGDGLETVADAEHRFAKVCRDADEGLHEFGGSRVFLAWFDETPRDRMRPALLAEVRRELGLREKNLE